MANALYPIWTEALLQNSADSDLDGTGSTGVWVALIDTGTYTYSAAHDFYSDLSGVVGTDVEIASGKKFFAPRFCEVQQSNERFFRLLEFALREVGSLVLVLLSS